MLPFWNLNIGSNYEVCCRNPIYLKKMLNYTCPSPSLSFCRVHWSCVCDWFWKCLAVSLIAYFISWCGPLWVCCGTRLTEQTHLSPRWVRARASCRNCISIASSNALWKLLFPSPLRGHAFRVPSVQDEYLERYQEILNYFGMWYTWL